MLDDPGVQYPVYLDPTIIYSWWTMINSQFPDQSYWSFDKTDCPSPFTGECAKVGQAVGYTMDYRSMWEFPTAEFQGKLITSAKFSIDLLYSPGRRPVSRSCVRSVHRSGPVPPGATTPGPGVGRSPRP